ncbi:hypothetical protein HK096_000843, partial [Nowakowskiella sp. JEL0078]
IHVYALDTDSGDLTFISKTETSVPSYVITTPGLKHLYACNELEPDGTVTSFSIDNQDNENGPILNKVNTVASLGAHPAHISISPHYNHSLLALANYSGGSISFHSIANGEISESIKHCVWDVKSDPTLETGPNKSRQTMSHPHQVYWNPRIPDIAYVCDLGLDRVVVLHISKDAEIEEIQVVKTFPGSGPRHIILHPVFNVAYLVEEMSCYISVFIVLEDGTLEFVSKMKILDHSHQIGFKFTSAGIKFVQNDQYLLVSQRGHNFIAVFEIITGSEGKELNLIRRLYLDGDIPRDFDVYGQWVLVGLQGSNFIQILKFADGTLEKVGKTFMDEDPQ